MGEKERNEDLKEVVERLTKEKSSLLERLADFEDYKRLASLQKEVLVRFRREIEYGYSLQLENARKIISSDARQRNQDLSYLVVDTSKDNFGKILVLTPEFERKFYFKNEEAKGRNYTKILKNSDNVDYSSVVKELFDSPEEIKIEEIIVDGKGKDRVVRFVKYSPHVVKTNVPDEKGNLIELKSSFTRVDVHDVGFLKKKLKGILERVYHPKNYSPRNLQEYKDQIHIKEILLENKQMAGEFEELIKKGMKSDLVNKIWGKSGGDIKRFRRECTIALKNIKKKKSKKKTRTGLL